MTDFLAEARARGFLHQITDEAGLAARLSAGPVTAYIGFDCTADSLHVGHLLSIMLLRLFQKHGHRPIVLVGGGTSKVGDPSGKDEARQLLPEQVIEANKAGIRRSFAPFLDFSDGRALMLDNAEWLDRLGYIPFLREIGRHFSVGRMLTMDSVRLRLRAGRRCPSPRGSTTCCCRRSISAELYRRFHGCILQMGGSDQWGNSRDGGGSRQSAGLEGRRPSALDHPAVDLPRLGGEGSARPPPARCGWTLAASRPSPPPGSTGAMLEDAGRRAFPRLVHRSATVRGGAAGRSPRARRVSEGEEDPRRRGDSAAARPRRTPRLPPRTARRTFEQGEAAETLPTIHHPLPAPVVDLAVAAGLAPAASKGEARRLIAQRGLRLNDVVGCDQRPHCHGRAPGSAQRQRSCRPGASALC